MAWQETDSGGREEAKANTGDAGIDVDLESIMAEHLRHLHLDARRPPADRIMMLQVSQMSMTAGNRDTCSHLLKMMVPMFPDTDPNRNSWTSLLE